MEAFERLDEAGDLLALQPVGALTQRGRNIRDEAIRGCAATGGVIGLNGIGALHGRPRGALRVDLQAHRLRGADGRPRARRDRPGLSRSRWAATRSTGCCGATRSSGRRREGYGTGLYRNAEPEQFPELTTLMVGAGYTETAIRGVLGENFLRVAREVWPGQTAASPA